jgi:hypothetical protein
MWLTDLEEGTGLIYVIYVVYVIIIPSFFSIWLLRYISLCSIKFYLISYKYFQ